VSQSASRRRWARVGNVLLVVLVTALQLAGLRAGSLARAPGLLAGVASQAVGVAVALIGGVALVWRRSRPVSVLAICVSAYAVNAVMVPGVPPYAGWLALYAAGAYGRRAARAWYAAAAGAAALGAVFAGYALLYPATADELPLLIAVTVIAALTGTLVRSRRAQLTALRDRAEALERERVSAEARAAAEERLRIARDVHDLVGHGLSGIAVQSSTARLALDAGKIETARTALAAVEAASRAALGEMRQLLGVLRAGDAGEHGRLPGLGDLQRLAGSMSRQGVMVTLRASEVGAVPGAVSLAAYRVVQEALTNVVKHGGGGRVTVEVGTSGGAVLVTVEDYADPAPLESDAGHPQLPGGAGQPPGGRAGGAGLAGMRERVAGFGGEVSAGPAGDHPGWRVRARIPYVEQDAG
jgi:signal transduction histidine kinase